jgi:hypothetical protein
MVDTKSRLKRIDLISKEAFGCEGMKRNVAMFAYQKTENINRKVTEERDVPSFAVG